MCIALLSTAHPKYSLILLNNRDVCVHALCFSLTSIFTHKTILVKTSQEFLTRPSAPLSWNPLHPSVLSGRDTLRPAHGTWLGITTTGLVAVLTNFREDIPPDPDARSRGEVINTFLTQPPGKFRSTADFVENLGDVSDVGGFTMVCGKVGEPLAVISNRATEGKEGSVEWVLGGEGGETVGVSNGAFRDGGWKKVVDGKEKLGEIIARDVSRRTEVGDDDENDFIEDLLHLLSTDTLPKRPVDKADWGNYLREFRHSIFIPVVGGEAGEKGKGDGMSGVYGTQKQSVVLVDKKGRVRFVERTLYDEDANPVEKEQGKRSVEFNIGGWGQQIG